jgi:hypothetical protein
VVDLTCTVTRKTTIEEVNEVFRKGGCHIAQGDTGGKRGAARVGGLHRQHDVEHGGRHEHQL